MGSYISNTDESLSFNRRIIQNISSERGEESVSDIDETIAEFSGQSLFNSGQFMFSSGQFLFSSGQFHSKLFNILAELIKF
ncbi:hypothetical protein AtubIFM56815_009804 [Aspergillus tubingensis]|uniref:Uncharacterized protein n=1 Tax=Aspergillus tubingensis TaxID=5068 RepID=A0A9W6ARG0_ASPTU|nr:hypothetical protein AtubIFM56815_009804 [Aspergillus tubingensis]